MNVSSVFDSFVGCLRSVFYKLQPGAAEEPPAASQLTTPTFSPTLPLLGELSGKQWMEQDTIPICSEEALTISNEACVCD